jgi:hypothetical protein
MPQLLDDIQERINVHQYQICPNPSEIELHTASETMARLPLTRHPDNFVEFHVIELTVAG